MGAAQDLYNRGVALQKANRLAEALNCYDQAIALDSGFARSFHNRGVILERFRRHEEALASYDAALACKPDFSEAANNRGSVLSALGRFPEALASFDLALQIDPGNPDFLYNRGNALIRLGRAEEALTSYDRAIARNPRHAGALCNRGNILRALGNFEGALANYTASLAIEPGQAAVLNSRGNLLWLLKRFEEALASYEAALRLMPRSAELHNNRGIMLWNLGRSEAALPSYDAALAFKPGDPDILNNRGNALRDLKRFEEALASYEHVLAAHPRHPYALDGAANAALNLCDWPRVARFTEKICAGTGGSVINPFTLLGYSGDMALQFAYAKKYIQGKMPAPPSPLWKGPAHHKDKIKLAYLSADFGSHATSTLMAGLVEHHDRSRFEISAFSHGPDDGSEMRDRLVRAFDHFIDVRTKSDEEVAQMLAARGVDIAVDLKGHTQGGRLAILSHRPCPVQVHYLGYPGTTGADFIDYVIADRIVAPFEQQNFFSEKIVHLPDCYQVNDGGRGIAPETPGRASAGLPAEGFIFCCFNNSWKITEPVFEIWMGLLAGVPGSVFWLIDDGSGPRTRLKAAAMARGIDPRRLVFAQRVPLQDHLARHRLADLMLDTLPVNAHTTASDALWAGLPLVTCLGDGFAGRVAASLLHAVGLPELVTGNLEDYRDLALRLARDRELRQSLRRKLEQNRLSRALFDTGRFSRAIEAAYTRMWEIAVRGRPAESFAVDAILQ